MKIEDLSLGIHKVSVEGVVFNISVVESYGVKGIIGFKGHQKVPPKSKHYLLTENVQEWIKKMILLDGAK